jgi:hypothetical protein
VRSREAPFTGMQYGQAYDLTTLVANDYVISGEFAICCNAWFLKINVAHVCLAIVREPKAAPWRALYSREKIQILLDIA